MPLNEADTCRKFVVPKLQAAGWETPPHAIHEQRTFCDVWERVGWVVRAKYCRKLRVKLKIIMKN